MVIGEAITSNSPIGLGFSSGPFSGEAWNAPRVDRGPESASIAAVHTSDDSTVNNSFWMIFISSLDRGVFAI